MLSAEDILASSDRIDRQARAMLQAIEDADVRSFLIQRDDLALDLSHHLTEIVKFVGAQIASRADAEAKAKVEACFQNLQEFSWIWTDYLAVWLDEAIAADEQLFLSESRSLLTKMRTQIKYSTELLCSLALRDGVIRLRAAEHR